MKKFKSLPILVVLLAGIISWNIFSSMETKATVNSLSENTIRFHVLANSDSKKDQQLKMLVKDNIVNFIYENTASFKNIEETKNFIISNDKTIQSIALNTIKSAGYDYGITSYFGKSAFPDKTYGDIIFPKGTYTSYTLTMGNGKGHNWWCVLYPPLCFVDTTTALVPDASKEQLKNSLSDTQYHTIVKFKFKYLTFLNRD